MHGEVVALRSRIGGNIDIDDAGQLVVADVDVFWAEQDARGPLLVVEEVRQLVQLSGKYLEPGHEVGTDRYLDRHCGIASRVPT